MVCLLPLGREKSLFNMEVQWQIMAVNIATNLNNILELDH